MNWLLMMSKLKNDLNLWMGDIARDNTVAHFVSLVLFGAVVTTLHFLWFFVCVVCLTMIRTLQML